MRPYTICHMLVSADGKISGKFLDNEYLTEAEEEYERVNNFYEIDAWLCGRVTMDDNFTFYKKPDLIQENTIYEREDFVADNNAKLYAVAIDTNGKLAWEKNYIEYLERENSHIIEVLTNKVSNEYIGFLRRKNISYIFAGEDELNPKLALEKLYKLFNIKKLAVSGGGIINWSFLDAGLIDEISLIISPLVDGSSNTNSIFERMDRKSNNEIITFTLKEVERVKENSLWIRYKVNNK